MKVKLGDDVGSDFGSGKVVAMSKQWCVYARKDGAEIAVPWEQVFIPADGPDAPESAIAEIET